MPSTKYKLYNDDCRVVCDKVLQPDSIDSVICDPPYGLKFMGKDWDHGIPGVPFWSRIMRVCKPGAILLAFGGTRTHHRLTCAIEDAGWEIRDCVLWLYGSGFPKSLNISKTIDKAAGAERKVVGVDPQASRRNKSTSKFSGCYGQIDDAESCPITTPTTEAAKIWDGWGTALKPAYEPILIAMKPLDGTYAENALKYGVAGINVDGCRIETIGDADAKHRCSAWSKHEHSKTFHGTKYRDLSQVEPPQGRWPANVILSHHPECIQVGMKKVKTNTHSQGVSAGKSVKKKKQGNVFSPYENTVNTSHLDADGLETVEEWNCHPDCPIAMFPETKSGALTRSATATAAFGKHGRYGIAKGKPDGAHFPASSGSAARFFYTAKSSKKDRNFGLPEGVESKHPTVKPLALMEYLCKLTMTPTGGIVLDPFMGSGSTGVACANVGRRFIGIENDTEHGYFEIAKQRVKEAYKKKVRK